MDEHYTVNVIHEDPADRAIRVLAGAQCATPGCLIRLRGQPSRGRRYCGPCLRERTDVGRDEMNRPEVAVGLAVGREELVCAILTGKRVRRKWARVCPSCNQPWSGKKDVCNACRALMLPCASCGTIKRVTQGKYLWHLSHPNKTSAGKVIPYTGRVFCDRVCSGRYAGQNVGWGNPDHPRHHPGLRTHCKRGHEMTPENVYTAPSPISRGRWCRICQRARAKRAYEAKKARAQEEEDPIRDAKKAAIIAATIAVALEAGVPALDATRESR